ncbi:MAG: MFS transporter [Terracidiphilus sp.]|jgi:MFS family permease
MASRSSSATTVLKSTAAASIPKVILGSALGTMIEWYDFYIFGSLATVLSLKFYPPGNDTFALIAYLATFAVGFLVRPFGALFFGRLGDLLGRRIAFIFTLTIMGFATASIGLLPTYHTAGWFSPIALILIRMLQGLALGGEYGGAAVFVAEHVPDNKRGFYTSFIQITATLGLFVSLAVIVATQQSMSPATFQDWGWRLPFLLSIVLVVISLYIRLKMKESPIFAQMKAAGMSSTKPLTDAFTKWANLKLVLISLFGATAGQGVVWYTGQFYALFYLQTVLKLNSKTANIDVAIALLVAMPFFTVFGALSDRIGRKNLMMTSLLLAVVFYIPIYKGMQDAAGNHVVSVSSVKDKVTGAVKLTPQTVDAATGKLVAAKEATNANQPMIILYVFLQVMIVCMIYGPIAAYLVEAFPAKVRYTSVSLPYHIGNGVFGGLLPLIGLGLCASTGNIYAGLFYPIGIAALTMIFGTFALKETHGTLIWEETERPA